jgi:hypothetical protein
VSELRGGWWDRAGVTRGHLRLYLYTQPHSGEGPWKLYLGSASRRTYSVLLGRSSSLHKCTYS